MRVGWSSFGLESYHSGVSRHGFSIYKELLRHGVAPIFIANSVQTLVNPTPRLFYASSSFLQRFKVANLYRYGEYLGDNASKFDVIHGLSNFNNAFIPPSVSALRVQTIHDLIPLLARYSKAKKLQFHWLVKRAIARSDIIICVSQWTKDSCEDYFPNARGKCHVIPNGISPRQPASAAAKASASALLFISRYEPYKGFDSIVQLAPYLRPERRLLIVTDQKGQKFLASQGLLQHPLIKVHVGVSDAKLAQLFGQALALLHPSYLEGYCLPAAEAISRGIPVVYRSGSAIDETVGEAGIGLSRHAGADAWVAAVDSLARRRSAPFSLQTDIDVQAGKLLSWSEVARQLISVYNDS